MQDRFVGDVGDFGKFGLLRTLCGAEPAMSIGVLWFVVSASERNQHGILTYYLEPKHERQFRPCDPELYDALKRIVTEQKRTLGAVEASGILPSATIFHRDELGFGDIPLWDYARRMEFRRQWFASAASLVNQQDIVFLDPDVGIAPQSLGHSGEKAKKYVLLDEIQRLVSGDASIVVYQQLGDRRTDSEKQVESWAAALLRLAPTRRHVWSITFTRGTRRAFLITPAERHEPILATRLERLRTAPWSEHFESLAAFERTKDAVERSSLLIRTAPLARSSGLDPSPARVVGDEMEGAVLSPRVRSEGS